MAPAAGTVEPMKYFLFVVMPILEILTAYLVARWIGLGSMLLVLIALSVSGIWQIKVQGSAAWRTARRDLERGGSPAPAAIDGVLRFLGALLLAVPGFLSAALGLVFLIGPVRNRASRGAGAWVVRRFGMPLVVVAGDGTTGWAFRSRRASEVVDVDGWEDPDTPGPERPAVSPPPPPESRR